MRVLLARQLLQHIDLSELLEVVAFNAILRLLFVTFDRDKLVSEGVSGEVGCGVNTLAKFLFKLVAIVQQH